MSRLRTIWETINRDGNVWIVLLVAAAAVLLVVTGHSLSDYAVMALRLVFMAVAMWAVLKFLRHLSNQLTDEGFADEVYTIIKKDPVALAVFFGLQFVGAAVLVSNTLP